MGTFHHDRGELHGITIVVETATGDLYVGRCDEIDEDRVILLDADVHRPGEDELSRDDYLERAERFGVWKKFHRLALPRASVTSVWRLGAGRAADAK